MDSSFEHDPRRPDGLHQLFNRSHLPTGHLPRHQHRPARSRECQLPALDAHGLHGGDRRTGREPWPGRGHVRPGENVQSGFRDLHCGLALPVVRLLAGTFCRDGPDRTSYSPGRWRRLSHGKLRCDPHRRIPARSKRNGPRDQFGGGDVGILHRPRRRGATFCRQLAPDLPGDRAHRDCRARYGPT